MINPTQRVSSSQPVAYNFPSPFPSVRLKSAFKRDIFLG